MLLGRRQQRFGLPEGQRGGDARIEPEPGDPEALLAAFKGGLRQIDLRFAFEQGEIGRCDIGDEREVERALVGLGSQILRAGSLRQIGDAAPEIEFEGRNADAYVVAVDSYRAGRTGRDRAQRNAAARCRGIRHGGGQAAAVLNAVLGPGLLDPRGGGDEIAIVRHCGIDERDEPGVAEPFPIGQGRGDHRAIRTEFRIIGRRAGEGGPFVIGGKVHTPRQCERQQAGR